MIFQEPMTSLNPVYTIGNQLREPLTLHRGLSEDDADAESVRLLEMVGIPAARRRVQEYPHQLSGGMRQRVMIAMALACDPRLLIADEPTTALDVTIQAQILELLRELQRELGMAILLITHDLGVVAEMAHRVVVMYAGRVVETGAVADVFRRPEHPYTAGLMHSVPRLDRREERLRPISGSVPDATRFQSGCRFHPRCAFRLERCDSAVPPLRARLTAARAEPGSATTNEATTNEATTIREQGPRATHSSACFYRDDFADADFLQHGGVAPDALGAQEPPLTEASNGAEESRRGEQR
jgi:oligopeptide/dipeptide ABC transporter ATP-binding protein